MSNQIEIKGRLLHLCKAARKHGVSGQVLHLFIAEVYETNAHPTEVQNSGQRSDHSDDPKEYYPASTSTLASRSSGKSGSTTQQSPWASRLV